MTHFQIITDILIFLKVKSSAELIHDLEDRIHVLEDRTHVLEDRIHVLENDLEVTQVALKQKELAACQSEQKMLAYRQFVNDMCYALLHKDVIRVVDMQGTEASYYLYKMISSKHLLLLNNFGFEKS
jgi:hypothetical protein